MNTTFGSAYYQQGTGILGNEKKNNRHFKSK